MSEWIKWCKCKRLILTTYQMEHNGLCKICQDEQHAQSFKDRIENLQKEEK